jgi:hypothetical protein
MPYADIEVGRAHRRAYQQTDAGKAAHTAANKAYRQRNKKRLAAHNAVAKAVLRKGLTAMPCLECGEAKTEAHHADYDRPLDVVWLCEPHHKETHRLFRELVKQESKH